MTERVFSELTNPAGDGIVEPQVHNLHDISPNDTRTNRRQNEFSRAHSPSS